MSNEENETPIVSIIIVSYNTKDMTLEAISSTIEQTQTPFELIVIDNASSDGSAEAIKDAYPDIRLLAEADNHGFSKANNIGSQYARGKYVLLLNPDTVVLDGAIDKLVRFADQNAAAKIWGGRTLYGDHLLNPTNCWRQMTVWSLACNLFALSKFLPGSPIFNREAYGGWKRNYVRNVDMVTGCFFLITKDFWDELGGFDEKFVMYGEEADLCWRARSAGANPLITPDAVIIHYVGAASISNSKKMIMVMRARVSLVRVQFSPLVKPIGLLLLTMHAASRALGATLTGKGKIWATVWKQRKDWVDGW